MTQKKDHLKFKELEHLDEKQQEKNKLVDELRQT